jgi:hypothetical protein
MVTPVTQKAPPSFDSWRLHKKMLMSCDIPIASGEPSGKSPEKPPRAITSGSCPACDEIKNKYAEHYQKQCCQSLIIKK